MSYTAYLKGSPEYSIDENGIMSIATVWMLVPKDNINTSKPATHWLAFQTDVEKFAGNPGDAFKRPKASATSREVTEYVADNTFLVSTVSWKCAEKRTHYEVAFTATQNLSEMQQIGNINVDVSENNEKTKSIRYRITVPPSIATDADDDPTKYPNIYHNDCFAIDSYVIASGTKVIWAEESYVVSKSTYTAQTARQYEVEIVATDMSAMLIGNVAEKRDGFGQRIRTATWRYSIDAYEALTLPVSGDKADSWVKEPDFIINGVDITPNGVLGYMLNISAVHVSRRHITTSITKSKQQGTEYKIKYQADKASATEFLDTIGQEAIDYGIEDGAYITEVDISETSKGDYEVTLSASKNAQFPENSNYDTPSKQITASATASSLTLTPELCGWAVMVNGNEYYEINFPPKTMYQYPLNPVEYYTTMTNSDTMVAPKAMLAAVNSDTVAVGYDTVVRVYDKDGKDITKSRASITTLQQCGKVIFQGFVYAQPHMLQKDGDSTSDNLRGFYFTPWNSKTDCVIIVFSEKDKKGKQTPYPTRQGRSLPLPRRCVNSELEFMEFSVSHNYKGNMAKVLKRDWGRYYKNAIDYVENDRFSSYRCISLTPSEFYDSRGDVWTTVTVVVQALSGNQYWNDKYTGDTTGKYYKHNTNESKW